ncbi:MAG: lipid-A-disaccharide synthase [Nitrospirota bacterium]|jgi:lipid-A-disaccharide synthase|nr:lipid-A-disaccharide synthase [Nitrospirota bacterium]MDH4361431.1 lipid-A-disaccharide synthase [Nitrospirota bacterium]MDH5296362.1 lipid-A-disaccharide synthase [Nitrospirota bacterium]
MPKILLVTGEASGDIHGAHLALALRKLNPAVELIGVGGSRMLAAGVSLLPDVDRVDAMGIPGIRQLMKGWKTLRTLSRLVQQEHFDAIILIDSPGLNLRLAKVASKMSHNIIYYIAPQVWAWGSRRLKLIRKVIKHVLAILPFEEKFFQKAGIACTYVGHPLLDELRPSYDKAHERQRFGLDPENMVIGLLPGSRVKEVQDMLPTLMKTVQQIQDRYPMLQVLLAQAHSLSDSVIHEFLGHSGQQVKVVKGQTNEVIAASDILLVTSGTATLQAALIGTPMVVLYRTSPLTYQIAKCLVKIPYISLVNLLAGKEIVPELIQNRMTPDCIAEEALEILRDTGRRDAMKHAFQSIRTSLGGPGASKRAAEIILAEAIS